MLRRSTDLLITATVPGTPEAVRAWYCDLANLSEAHPLIVTVRRTAHDCAPDGSTRTDYLVTDRMVVLGARIRFTYRVRITAPAQGPVATEARQFPGICLAGEVSFTPEGTETSIRERLTVRAPRPLLGYVAKQAERAHSQMFTTMDRLFRSRALPGGDTR